MGHHDHPEKVAASESLPTIEEVVSHREALPSSTLTLAYDARKRSRQRVRLDDGRWAALLLPRGTLLRGGDCLRSSTGELIAVAAAPESVSTVTAADAVMLTRVAYHLGNRHVPLQVGAGWLRYQHDHVLDAMVRGLGGVVQAETATFEPEAGAHAPAGASHGHHHHDGDGHGHHH